MNRSEAIKNLREFDHGIISQEHAQQLAEPFGVRAQGQVFKVGQDRVVSGVAETFIGIAAEDLAEQIALSLGQVSGKDYPRYIGVGSRLRGACDAVDKALGIVAAQAR